MVKNRKKILFNKLLSLLKDTNNWYISNLSSSSLSKFRYKLFELEITWEYNSSPNGFSSFIISKPITYAIPFKYKRKVKKELIKIYDLYVGVSPLVLLEDYVIDEKYQEKINYKDIHKTNKIVDLLTSKNIVDYHMNFKKTTIWINDKKISNLIKDVIK